MRELLTKFVDWFIPSTLRESASDWMMARTFVTLHLVGPLMGHAVTYFLAGTPAGKTWQFWVTEAMVAGFLAIPLVVRASGSLKLPAVLSTQMLICLSLFGSFFFGGISSPFLPWFLIAMILGFFFLAGNIRGVLAGLMAQLICFFCGRLLLGSFPKLLPDESLIYANLLSITAALAYMTLLALYYEKVMRISMEMEAETAEQRQRLESLRSAMQAAELASKRKSIFLAKMSHELRTPLNAVIGYTEMLRETCEERATDPRKIEDLDRIRAAGRHLLELVDNVVDLSSIEANRLELITETIAVHELIKDAVSTATPLMNKRDNQLIVTVPDNLGSFELDALKLRQSILNLLSNAAKFTTKGTISLSARLVKSAGRDTLEIEVADNGIGMTEEGVSRIFADFSQAESDTSSKFGGTGLGLALTRRFCEMMGGSIAVRSARGVGSVFTIKIPVARAASRSRNTKAAA